MGKNNNFLTWESIDWQIVTSRVLHLQRRVYKAQASGSNKHRIHGLQQLLINSLDSKLFPVRLVTTLNKGRQIPGVDKQVIVLHDEKMALARRLSLDGKSSRIVRSIYLQKKNAQKIRVVFKKTHENASHERDTRSFCFAREGILASHEYLFSCVFLLQVKRYSCEALPA